MLKGNCDDKFIKLYSILEDQLSKNNELGCSVSVEWKGKEVVNLYGGYKDINKKSLWQEDTLVNVWSVTKAITGICITKLANDGLLDVNKKVSHYWPEYGCNGKEETKVIDLLTHRAGMFGFQNGYPNVLWNDWDVFVKTLEQQKPFRVPGSTQSYHAITFSWLVGELFKKIEGRTIGVYFKEEIAEPFDIDFHIGLPTSEHHRCADVILNNFNSLSPPIGFMKYIPNFFLNNDLKNMKNTLVSKDFLKAFTPELFNTNDPNSEDWRTAELPAGNGHGTASSLAKLFGILANGCERDNKKIMDTQSLNKATKILTSGPDTVLFGVKLNFGYCFMLEGNKNPNINFAPIFNKGTFGHAGIGGSVAFGDQENQLGYCFLGNKQQKSSKLYKTSNMLTKALYETIS